MGILLLLLCHDHDLISFLLFFRCSTETCETNWNCKIILFGACFIVLFRFDWHDGKILLSEFFEDAAQKKKKKKSGLHLRLHSTDIFLDSIFDFLKKMNVKKKNVYNRLSTDLVYFVA